MLGMSIVPAPSGKTYVLVREIDASLEAQAAGHQ